MINNILTPRRTGFTLVIAALMLVALVPPVAAQGGGPTLVQTAEYEIGFDCPQAAALDPAGTAVWVLTGNCGMEDYTLHAYSVADGTPLDVGDWSGALANLDGVLLDVFITPMAFTPAGDLSIRYNDLETYASFNLVIPLASGGEPVVQSSASYDALLAGLSPYPEFSTYSRDHTRVATMGDTEVHVIDVQTESEIAVIPIENGAEVGYFVTFTPDGEHLAVSSAANPDDMTDFSMILRIYSLPDATLTAEYTLPFPLVALSPDGTKAAINLISNEISERSELAVIDLASGQSSPASNLLEASRPVFTCLNNGRDVSDLGFVTSGYFGLTSLDWLPDSSGLVVTLSARGDGSMGDAGLCIFNTSRLRTYRVGG